jgi:ketosteroid isomerase-like protein
MTNSQIVKYVYEKFAQGDAASVLATFDQTVEFRLAEGHPYQPEGKPWFGADAITRNFFMKAGAEWDGWAISCDELLDLGDAVVVECQYTGIYKPTGKRLDVQVCHVWRFGNGKIKSFHQYLDTARLQEVMGKR